MKTNAKVWRLIPHHLTALRNDSIDWYLDNHIVAIGWGAIGDMSVEEYATPKAIGEAIQTKCKLTNRIIGGPSLWHYYNDIQEGDYIILSGTEHKRPVVRVSGSYIFKPQGFNLDADYKHQISIDHTDINYKDLINGTRWKPKSGQSIRCPLIECHI